MSDKQGEEKRQSLSYSSLPLPISSSPSLISLLPSPFSPLLSPHSSIPLRGPSRTRTADLSPPAEFNILPHPAKTNNPSDLNSEPATHGGLQSASANAYNARGPHVPAAEVAEGLEKPKGRDEVVSRLGLSWAKC
jgi:hypothetical protein